MGHRIKDNVLTMLEYFPRIISEVQSKGLFQMIKFIERQYPKSNTKLPKKMRPIKARVMTAQ